MMNYQADTDRYNSMLYQRCGKSGLKLPALSLGLWHNFGGVDSFESGRSLILRAFDCGITNLDLANNYGPPPGSAEETMGKVLRKDLKSYRDELIISTKAGYDMWPGPYGNWGSKKYLTASLEQSLKRMGLDYVDIFYSHRYDPDTPLEETMEALYLAVIQGKALYAGISNYPPEQTKKAVKLLEARGIHCLIHQVKYSMFVRDPEAELFDLLKKEGVGCIAFSPLAQGLLTDRYLHGIPMDSRISKFHGFLKKEHLNESVMGKIQDLTKVAQKRNQTLAQMALAWVLRQPVVTSALIGASRIEQLESNMKIFEHVKFEDSELQEIDQILKG